MDSSKNIVYQSKIQRPEPEVNNLKNFKPISSPSSDQNNTSQRAGSGIINSLLIKSDGGATNITQKVSPRQNTSPKISPRASKFFFEKDRKDLKGNSYFDFGIVPKNFTNKKCLDEEKMLEMIWNNLSFEQKKKLIIDTSYRTFEDGTTYLIWACKYNRIDIVIEFILNDCCNHNLDNSQNIDSIQKLGINVSDNNKMTPLMWAGRQGNIKIVEVLLCCENINLNDQDKKGNTLLHHLAIKKQTEILKLLLIDVRINVLISNNDQKINPITKKQERTRPYDIIKDTLFEIDEIVRYEWFARELLEYEVDNMRFEFPYEMKSKENAILDNMIIIIRKRLLEYRHGNEDYQLLPVFITDEFIKDMIKYRTRDFS